MLSNKDKQLIEKYLDNKPQPNSPALSNEEEIIFDERMQDLDFQNHLKLSDEVNKTITNDDEIRFIKTLEKVAKAYHNRLLKNNTKLKKFTRFSVGFILCTNQRIF